ncbi:hypothetical protein PMAYCL1PPCAC_03000 [Pristionchus mayeri]|uniref:Uncharacterized protein n=1 Tax=Pristionchus mayeri TaxID=1317129 RepID=A0AAN4Z986_9BILA|nr:hypothetical protein PMAYCL1PPCAC_03000 [Pristionchus mayeri]
MQRMQLCRMRGERPLLYLLCTLCACILFFLFLSPQKTIDRGRILEYLREEEMEKGGKEGRKEQKIHKDDEHMAMIDHSSTLHREPYPRRKKMSACPPLYGRVGVFVAYVKSSMETHYAVAQRTLECYLKSVNYTVFMVDLDNDERVKHTCYKNQQLFFRKHCAASVYLKEVDWMLILDADTAIVNPNHCIEEWIDTRADLVFYERYFNWEIASGNYLAKNTDFARNFLKKWADWEFIQPQNWNGADNGVLQIHILEAVIPSAVQEIRICDEIWHKGTDYDTYMAFVTCCKMALGATRLWPGKVRIYRRAHGWVRDGFLADDGWAETDFMLHGYKAQKVGQDGWASPFTEMPDPAKCGSHTKGWPWRKEKMFTVEEVRMRLSAFEGSTGKNYPQKARVIPYLEYPDVGDCFPHCDDMV